MHNLIKKNYNNKKNRPHKNGFENECNFSKCNVNSAKLMYDRMRINIIGTKMQKRSV